MLNERRAFHRFPAYAVIECKSSRTWSIPFFGTTRNLSREGICFESQAFDLRPGDEVEVKIRYPRRNLLVTNSGEIVWKKKSDKFDHMSGIRFREVDEETEKKILEILSAENSIPADVILSGDEEMKTDDEMERENPQTEVDRGGRGVSLCGESPPEKGFAENEETERNDQDSVTLAEDLFRATRSERRKNRGESLHQDIRDVTSMTPHESGLLQEEMVIRYDGTKDQKKEKIINRTSLGWGMVFTVLLVLTVFVITEYLIGPSKIPQAPEVRQDEGRTGAESGKESIPAGGNTLQLGSASEHAETGQYEDREPITGRQGETGGEDLAEPSPSGQGKYVVQVGAWKQARFAEKTLRAIQQSYPEAYIAVESSFSKIRIPGIMTKKEGAMIVKDIERSFRMKPLLLPDR